MTRTNLFLFGVGLYLAGTWLSASLNANKILNKHSDFTGFYEQKVYAQGIIVSDPGKSGYLTTFYLKPDNASQKILVSTLSRQDFKYGDAVRTDGKLRETLSIPGEHFDYRNYLRSRGVYGQISYAQVFILAHNRANPIIYYCLLAKRAVYKQIFKNLSYEHAALLVSLLTGQKDFLSKLTLNNFSATGTAHVVAVSGFILTLIMLGFENLAPYIGRRTAHACAVLAALIYLTMTAFAPGVVRAAAMSALVIAAKIIGRRYALLPALAFTAAVLVSFEPLIIKYDLGFLLSFASILGIYFLNPVSKQFMGLIPEKFGAREIIATTLSAQLATIPITLYYFDQFSLVAPLANLLVLPLVPALSIFGYVCALPLLGRAAGFLFSFPLSYMLTTVASLARLPGASAHFSISPWLVFGIYAAEILSVYSLKKRAGFATI